MGYERLEATGKADDCQQVLPLLGGPYGSSHLHVLGEFVPGGVSGDLGAGSGFGGCRIPSSAVDFACLEFHALEVLLHVLGNLGHDPASVQIDTSAVRSE